MQTEIDKSDERTIAEIRGHGWTGRISFSNVLVIALITGASTGAVSLATRSEPKAPDMAELRKGLAEIKEAQRQILDKVMVEAQESRNRDAVQDASIAALRNR